MYWTSTHFIKASERTVRKPASKSPNQSTLWPLLPLRAEQSPTRLRSSHGHPRHRLGLMAITHCLQNVLALILADEPVLPRRVCAHRHTRPIHKAPHKANTAEHVENRRPATVRSRCQSRIRCQSHYLLPKLARAFCEFAEIKTVFKYFII